MHLVFKLTGAFAILAAASLMGWLKADGFNERVRTLQDCRRGLDYLQTSITYSSMLLPQALAEAGNRLCYPASALFLVTAGLLQKGEYAVENCWQAGLEELAAGSVLKPSDLRILISLGSGFDFGDADSQKRHLLLVNHELITAIEQAEAEAAGNVKMWRYLGVMGGIFLIIILF